MGKQLMENKIYLEFSKAAHYLAVGLVAVQGNVQQEATLTELIHTNQIIVDNTQQTDKKLLKYH